MTMTMMTTTMTTTMTMTVTVTVTMTVTQPLFMVTIVDVYGALIATNDPILFLSDKRIAILVS